jgi:hypothetical protein
MRIGNGVFLFISRSMWALVCYPRNPQAPARAGAWTIYVVGDFSIDHEGFNNQTKDEKAQILAYPLMIYVCEGTDKEKPDWFIKGVASPVLQREEAHSFAATHTSPHPASVSPLHRCASPRRRVASQFKLFRFDSKCIGQLFPDVRF